MSNGALALWLAVAVPSVVGLLVPAFYDALFRDPSRIHDGQWWRLLTYVVVQDGGAVGTTVNLVFLAIVAATAVPPWGAARAVTLFLCGTMLFGVLAAFAWSASGGGNSAATFFLAAATAALVAVRRRSRVTIACASGELLIGGGLVVVGDGHGVVVLAGLVVVGDGHGVVVLAGLVAGALLATFTSPPDGMLGR